MAKYTLGRIFDKQYTVTQRFGERPEYYGQFTIYGVKQKGHEGIDYATPTGTPIYAPFNGVILRQDFQSDFKNYGKVVVVWNKDQRCAPWFCHLSEEYVTNGRSVVKGQLLGKTGATGNVQGTHLHFGIVETDQNGNRLHAYDGFGGFIDALDPNLVAWESSPLNDTQKVNAITLIMQSTSNNDTKVAETKKILGL